MLSALDVPSLPYAYSRLLPFFVSPDAGQVNTATMLGSVTDSTGAVVSSAVVSITNVATQAARAATTDPTGAYIFERLPVGDYSLAVKAPGFKRFERTDIHLDATATRQDRRGHGGRRCLRKRDGKRWRLPCCYPKHRIGRGHRGVPGARLPLNGRNFSQLIALEPGAVVSGGAVYFNGLSRDNVNISVDGTDASNPDRPSTADFGGQTQQNILSVEFVQEFKTTKGVFSAESDAPPRVA